MLLLVVFLPSVNYIRPEYELNEIATLKMLYESMANFSFIFMTTYLLVTNFKGKKCKHSTEMEPVVFPLSWGE